MCFLIFKRIDGLLFFCLSFTIFLLKFMLAVSEWRLYNFYFIECIEIFFVNIPCTYIYVCIYIHTHTHNIYVYISIISWVQSFLTMLMESSVAFFFISPENIYFVFFVTSVCINQSFCCRFVVGVLGRPHRAL